MEKIKVILAVSLFTVFIGSTQADDILQPSFTPNAASAHDATVIAAEARLNAAQGTYNTTPADTSARANALAAYQAELATYNATVAAANASSETGVGSGVPSVGGVPSINGTNLQ